MIITYLGLFFLYLAWEEGLVKVRPDRIHYAMAINVSVGLAFGWIVGLLSPTPDKAELLAGMKEVLDLPTWRLWLAGFEDAIFVLPLFMLREKWRPTFMVFMAVAFATAHSYQGFVPAAAKLVFVPVVYLMAKRWGILTTMIAHSLQDVLAVALLRRVLPI